MDLKLDAQPGSLAYYCTIGNLREALKYRSREAMGRNWITIFPGEILPEDHQQVSPDAVMEFVTEIAKPKKGRPGSITSAAQFLLKTLTAIVDSIKNFPVEKSELSLHEIIYQKTSDDKKTTSTTSDKSKTDVVDNVGTRLNRCLMSLTKLDIVFMITIGVADYGLFFLLSEMGLVAAVVYTMISLHSLDMTKNRHSKRTANTGIAAVVILEIGAFFIHLTMFNMRIWKRINDMPFRVDDIATEGRPFYIALVFAILLSAAGIYAVSTTLSLMVEKNDAEEFETTHEGYKW